MSKNYNNKIAITTGDVNGIGAEITIKALNALNLPPEDAVLISNSRVLDYYGTLNIPYEIIEIPYNEKIQCGKLMASSGEFSFKSLLAACQINPRAIVTAPVSKEALHLAGHKFGGQTEILEKYLAKNNQKAEMLFVSDKFDVFLLTRHLPLLKIQLTKDIIVKKITRLTNFYNNPKAKFALCALNPHAGEDGILGTEEIDIIVPAVNELRKKGIDITMPLPADTLFVDAVQNYIKGEKAPYDCYIAMYHDQGLIPIKSIAGDKTVNTTIGLPIIRTSPSHGTAFDIAGKNIAKEASMIEAINTAIKLTQKCKFQENIAMY